jgi:tetratricopeptide (TPR) repeat protein
MKPFCFVLMPFGQKPDENNRLIDFDRVYAEIIKPAVHAADLDPIRADKETVGDIIHKPMFERLMLCDYAVADLTSANANVFYELGIRRGIRPYGTVLIFAQGTRLPFDMASLRGLPYRLNVHGAPEKPREDSQVLAERLRSCRKPVEDSPLFQVVSDLPRPEIARLKTDTFREVVDYSRRYKEKLQAARRTGIDAVRTVERELNVRDADPAIVVDLLLSYRAVEDWESMVKLVDRMAPVLARTVMVREQLGFALNRLDRHEEAEATLRAVIEEHGASSETNGLLGRVYKDRWQKAASSGRQIEARGWLRKAIETYLAGYKADIRDAYPGVNAVTLMEMDEPVDQRQAELLPVVRFAVKQRLASKSPDYWDHAALLELSVLADDQRGATEALANALAALREPWELQTTARNLRLIREARSRRGRDVSWIAAIEDELERAHDAATLGLT